MNRELLGHFKAFVLQEETDRVLSCKPPLGWLLHVIDLPESNIMAFTYREGYGNDERRPCFGDFQLWQQSGVMKGKGDPLYYSNVKALFDKMGPDRTPIELAAGDQLPFSTEWNGMHNFSFTLHSGQLVAIMGKRCGKIHPPGTA